MAQNGFVELDTVTHAGVHVINKGRRLNALNCYWQESRDSVTILSPYKVARYSINGVEYVAKDIEINGEKGRFFFEKMASGKLTLYFLQNKDKHFFLERGNDLLELTKWDALGNSHYREVLQTISSDCNYSSHFLKHTWFSRYYLKRFVMRYNSCEEVYHPIRFGIVGGLDYSGYPMLKSAWNVSETPFAGSFTFGVFADFPILQSKVSLHFQLLYSKQAYRVFETLNGSQDNDCIANIESFAMPLLFRYTWWKSRWSPYLNVGATGFYYSRLESSVLRAIIDDWVLDIRQIESKLSPIICAATGGVGVWYHLSKRNALFVEVRATFNVDRYSYHIVSGINF